ncbi:hypothetical protein EDD17DRAFT_1515125 [Pisolithus thermaeus]|nr:hypothetical protein EV401DRAFT_1890359 [Pisolithus croceorrhizus]KAI6144856.1 hypothetical protein EDD17DRAFT_1515125 [Pisolithus thermaeus]
MPLFKPIPYHRPPSSEISGALPHLTSEPSSSQLIPYNGILPLSLPIENSNYDSNEPDHKPAHDVYGTYGADFPSSSDIVNESTSLANSSFISLHSGQSSLQAVSHRNTNLWRSYLARDQDVLKQAWILMIYEMVTNIGWPVTSLGETACKQWKNTICEVLSQASAMIPGDLLSPMKGIECLLIRALTLFCAELAGKAMPYAKQFFWTWPSSYGGKKIDVHASLTHPNMLISSCMSMMRKVVHWFGNQHLKALHISFWYTCDLSPMKVEAAKDVHTTPLQMYALLAVVSSYAIKCESKHVDEILPHMPFTGTEFSPLFEMYYNSLIIAMQHATLGARLKEHFNLLHQNGFHPINSHSLEMPMNYNNPVGASGSMTSVPNMAAMCGTSWSMEFQGFGSTYYEYDM